MAPKPDYGVIRGYVVKYLLGLPKPGQRQAGQSDIGNVVSHVLAIQQQDDRQYAAADVDMAVCLVIHDLYEQRVLLPGYFDPFRDTWPRFTVTDHGRQVLSDSTEYLPYDPEGYLTRLANDCPRLDAVIRRYAAEALECLKRNCPLAGAVAIGCASERALLLLIDQFGVAVPTPDKPAYEADTKVFWQISKKYNGLRKWIDADNALPRGPGGLREGVGTHLVGMFSIIKETRNDAGHPSVDTNIDRDRLRDDMVMFSRYVEFVYKLLAHYAANAVNGRP